MKLLYIANERIPTDRANGLQIMKTCEALAREGVEIELVIPRRKTEAMAEDPFDYYRVEKVFKLKKLPCLDLIPYLYFLGPIPYRLITVTFSLSAAFYSLKHKHDFLYFRHDPVLFWFLLFVQRKNLIGEFHFLAEKKYQRFFHHLRLIVTINRSAKEIYEAFLTRPDLVGGKIGSCKTKIILAPDGVSIEDFDIPINKEEARIKLGLPTGGRYVVYTGHFYSWKGIDTLIKAAALLSKDITILLVGGDTPEDSPLFKNQLSENMEPRGQNPSAFSLQLNPVACPPGRNPAPEDPLHSFPGSWSSGARIKLTGQKKYSEIPLYLKAADCLVITGTKTDERSFYFTSPLKLFEYMAVRRPIVASGTNAVQEVLVHNKNAWLVEPDDEKALAERIRYVLDNSEVSESISREARMEVENYTWERRAQKIVEAIKNLQ